MRITPLEKRADQLTGSFAPGSPRTVRVDLAAAFDDRGLIAAPVTAMIELAEGWRTLDFPTLDLPVAGPDVQTGPISPMAGEFRITLVRPEDAPAADIHLSHPDCALLPGLVNAHTHLDLTDVGPYEAGRGDFPAFIARVRKLRPVDDPAIETAVRRGIDLSLVRGVVAVGDIAGCPPAGPNATPLRTLARSALSGVSFLEFFGIGPKAAASAERAIGFARALASDATAAVKLGLQPHAPYSVSPEGYRHAVAAAAELGFPLATHLAESPAEHQLIAEARGPQREFLEALGLWNSTTAADFGMARTPIEHLSHFLSGEPKFLAVHCNDVSRDPVRGDLGGLAKFATAVAYCPRSSAYFDSQAHFGPHRFDEMLASGIRVCLGTDSIINIPEADADPARNGGLSVFEEARILRATRGHPAKSLVAMLTTYGAAGLGLPVSEFRFGPLGRSCSPRGLSLIRGVSSAAPEDTLFAPGTVPYLLLLRNFSR